MSYLQYDPKIHITTEQFADLLGVAATTLRGNLSAPGAPRSLGKGSVQGRRVSMYDRDTVVAWVNERRETQQIMERRRRMTPARVPKPLNEQGTYRPSPQLRMNEARAAALYPHRFIVPQGRGNDRAFAFDHDRVRLTK